MAMGLPIFFYTSRPMAFRVIKVMMMNLKLLNKLCALLVVLALLPVRPAFGLIPEPDNLVYGSVSLDGEALTAANNSVTIVLSHGDVIVDRYTLGDSAAAGDRYLLTIPTDTVLQRNPNALRKDDSLKIYYQSGSVYHFVQDVQVAERGHMEKLNLVITSKEITNSHDNSTPGGNGGSGGDGGTGPVDSFGNADADEDGIGNDFESTHDGLNPYFAGDALLDNDGDGMSNLDEYLAETDINHDEIAPSCRAPVDLTVDSQGTLTAVMLGDARAVDPGTGTAVAIASDAGPFRPGLHDIIWTCRDLAGNTSSDAQVLKVLPRMDLAADQVASEGGMIQVCLKANGDAPILPVTVAYVIEGDALAPEDHNASEGEFVFDEDVFAADKTVCMDIAITDDGQNEGVERFNVTLTQAQNAVIGDKASHKVTIVEGNVGPVIALTVMQDGSLRDYISPDGGSVTITAQVFDANLADEHTLSWLVPGSWFTDTDGDPSNNVFVFDPSALPLGQMYSIAVTATDNGSPAISTTQPIALAFQSIDGPEKIGGGLEPHQLPGQTGAVNNYIMETESGLWLLLGELAKASGSDHVVLSGDEFIKAAASQLENMFMNLTGYFDSVVSGLSAPGLTSSVVLPLLSEVPPAPVFQVLIEDTWVTLSADDHNHIRSARGQQGVCPAVGSGLYQPGLNPGDWCVQLTLQDGGDFDADQLENGSIEIATGISSLTSLSQVGYSQLPELKVPRDAVKVALAHFEIKNSAEVELSGLTLQASGTGNEATDVERLEIWLDANMNGSWDEGDQKLGEGHFSQDDERLVIDFVSPVMLEQGNSEILITYDFYAPAVPAN